MIITKYDFICAHSWLEGNLAMSGVASRPPCPIFGTESLGLSLTTLHLGIKQGVSRPWTSCLPWSLPQIMCHGLHSTPPSNENARICLHVSTADGEALISVSWVGHKN